MSRPNHIAHLSWLSGMTTNKIAKTLNRIIIRVIYALMRGRVQSFFVSRNATIISVWDVSLDIVKCMSQMAQYNS